MKKLKLYLETSVFGFYFDTAVSNQQKRIAVRKLLQQIKKGVFEGYVSGLVRAELEKAPQPYRDRLLRLIDRYGLKAVEYDEGAAGELHEQYLRARWHLELPMTTRLILRSRRSLELMSW